MRDYRRVWLDLDGTLADTYNVPNWLERLKKGDATVFDEAEPANLFEVLDLLRTLGGTVRIITMLPEPPVGFTDQEIKEYEREVREIKEAWISRNFPYLIGSPLITIKYGESKAKYCNTKNDVLIDDSIKQLSEWKGIAIRPPWTKPLDTYFEEREKALLNPDVLVEVIRNELYKEMEQGQSIFSGLEIGNGDKYDLEEYYDIIVKKGKI